MAPELTQLDVERLASGVSKTLHGLSDHLADFHKLLETPPQVCNLKQYSITHLIICLYHRETPCSAHSASWILHLETRDYTLESYSQQFL